MLISPIPLPYQTEEPEDSRGPSREDDIPFTRSTHSSFLSFDPVWANAKWQNLAQGTRLLECMDIDGARELGDWLTGARAVRKSREGISNIEPSYRDAPEGFWEPELLPCEDRSAKSDPLSGAEIGEGLAETDVAHPEASTMRVNLIQPVRLSLEFTKTSVAIWQRGPGSTRTQVHTHTFIIITTTPCSAVVVANTVSGSEMWPHPGGSGHDQPVHFGDALSATQDKLPSPAPRVTVLPSHVSASDFGTQLPLAATLGMQADLGKSTTPTEEIMALDLSILPDSSITSPSRPIFFNRDGTVTRHGPVQRSVDKNGKSLDVNELLRTKDWSQTPLGPREYWPQSLKTIGNSVFLACVMELRYLQSP